VQTDKERSFRWLELHRGELVVHDETLSTAGSRMRTVVPMGVESRLKSLDTTRMIALP